MNEGQISELINSDDEIVAKYLEHAASIASKPKIVSSDLELKFMNNRSYAEFHNNLIHILTDVKTDTAKLLLAELFSASSYEQYHTAILNITDVDSSPFKLESYKGILTRDDDDAVNRLNGSNKLKGDMFEVFSYVFFKHQAPYYHLDPNSIRLASYDQEGWDIYAKNIAGTSCLIQAKFHGNLDGTYGSIKQGERDPLSTFWRSFLQFKKENPTLPDIIANGDSVSSILITSAPRVATQIKIQAGFDESEDFQSATCPFSIVTLDKIESFTNINKQLWTSIGNWWEDLVDA